MNVLMLVLSGALVGLHGHRPLLWLAGRRVDPTILLTGWTLLTVGLVGSAATTTALLGLPPDDHHEAGLFQLAGGCWTAVTAGTLPGWRQGSAALGVALTSGILGRLGWAVLGAVRASRQQTPHLGQSRLLALGAPPGEPLWVDDDRAMAVSIGGRPGLVIATEGLRRQLPPAAVHAALEHERAHLRGRHHVLVAIVETLAAAFPWCPLLREAPAATRDLVELAADARAAGRCGPEAVRTALHHLTGQPTPAFGLAMASRLTELRMSRLSCPVNTQRLLRWPGSVAMALSALALPTATGWVGADILACLVG